MKRITNLSELLKNNIKRVYGAEQQQLEVMPQLAERASTPALKSTISALIKIKKENIDRLKESFQRIGLTPRGQKCEVMQELINECQTAVAHSTEEHVADAALINSIQQINHHNIANYGTLASFAGTLKQGNVSQLLHRSLEKEKEIDRQLSQIAEASVNPAAVPA